MAPNFTETPVGNPVPDHPKDEERLLRCLDRTRLIQYLLPDQKRDLVRRMTLHYFDAGDVILKEGTPGDYFWIVESGELDLMRGSTVLTQASRGCSFGEQGIVYGSARSGSVRAKTNALVWGVSKENFQAALESSEEIREEFLRFSSEVDAPPKKGSLSIWAEKSSDDGKQTMQGDESSESGRIRKAPTRVMTQADFERSLGITSAAERIHAGITRARLQQLFDLADVDCNGVLTFAEYAKFSLLLSKPEPTYDIAFKLFDVNKDGVITLEEFKTVMKQSKGTKMLHGVDKIDFDMNTTFVRDHFGPDGNRRLSFHEFSNFFVELQAELLRQVFHNYEDPQGYVPLEKVIYMLSNRGSGWIPPSLLRRIKGMSGLSGAGTGAISFAEFQAFMRLVDHIPAIIATVKAANVITRGRGVSMDEFKTAAQATGLSGLSPLEAAELFNIADQDKDGRITVEDVTSLLQFPVSKAKSAVGGDVARTGAVPRHNKSIKDGSDKKQGDDGEQTGILAKVGSMALSAIKNFVMGAIAGGVGAASVFPIDTAKTILQDQRIVAGKPPMYKNTLDCLFKILRTEGVRRLYRGLGPQLIGVAPEKAIKLTVNDLFRSMFSDPANGGAISFPLEVLAGGSAGASQVCVTNPLEITKLRLQLQASSGVRKSALQIVKELGFGGLYKGASACLLRDVPFSALYFPSYAACKELFAGEDGTCGPWQLLTAGAVAGAPAASLTTPADVIKTRLQAEHKPGQVPYAGMRDCFTRIVHEEGALALMKGSGARVFRSSPQFGVTLLAYELLHSVMAPEDPPVPYTTVPVSEDDILLGGASRTAKLRAIDEKLSRLR